jgi:hypothetical protein
MNYQGRQQGDIKRGRIIVGVAVILVLAANSIIYRQTTLTPYAVPGLQPGLVIAFIWMVAGAIALCMRQPAGRFFTLLVLYGGTFAFFMIGILVLANAEAPVFARAGPMFVAAVIYLAGSIAITSSVHVQRLTRRTWE